MPPFLNDGWFRRCPTTCPYGKHRRTFGKRRLEFRCHRVASCEPRPNPCLLQNTMCIDSLQHPRQNSHHDERYKHYVEDVEDERKSTLDSLDISVTHSSSPPSCNVQGQQSQPPSSPTIGEGYIQQVHDNNTSATV